MANEPNNHIVAIVNDGTTCRITPVDVLAKVGDTITYYNLTDGPATVHTPDEDLFTEPTPPIGVGQSVIATVSDKAQLGGYAYSAYCSGKREFAHASIPRIIIYDNIH